MTRALVESSFISLGNCYLLFEETQTSSNRSILISYHGLISQDESQRSRVSEYSMYLPTSCVFARTSNLPDFIYTHICIYIFIFFLPLPLRLIQKYVANNHHYQAYQLTKAERERVDFQSRATCLRLDVSRALAWKSAWVRELTMAS